MAGYRLGCGDPGQLTYNQELFVALVAEEEIKFRARLAGADIKEDRSRAKFSRRRKTDSEDNYGRMLEHKRRMKEAANEFQDISDCMKPL